MNRCQPLSVRFQFEPVASVKPLDENERWGKVADHSVVRCRVAAVANSNPYKPRFIDRSSSHGGRIFGGRQRWTTEWSTTLASPLSNP
jgi:hypothetical protein